MSPFGAVASEDTDLGTVVVYGLGGFGRRLLQCLQEAGCSIAGVSDEAHGEPISGFPVMTPEEVAGLDVPVIIGISNFLTDIHEIERNLRKAGVSVVISPVEASIALRARGVVLDNYWMSGRVDYVEAHAAEIASARELLADEESRTLFDQVLQYRVTGSIGACPKPQPLRDQYFPQDVPISYNGQVRFVDGGAFNGDTVLALVSRGIAPDALMCFEPDPSNLAKLAESVRVTGLRNVVVIPSALGSRTEIQGLQSGLGAASAVSATANTLTQVLRLDDVASSWFPTHVKLDIEGLEEEALDGMRSLLQGLRPVLAVATYHLPHHHWSIPLKVHNLQPEYRFYLRNYGHQTFDTILYCL